MIIELYLLFPFLVLAYKKIEAAGKAEIFMLGLLALYILWYGVLDGTLTNAMTGYSSSASDLDIILSRLFFPFLLLLRRGMYASRNRARIMNIVSKLSGWPMIFPALFLALVLQFLGSGFFWSLVLLPFSAIMAALLCRLSIWLNEHKNIFTSALRTIGLYSFGIYLVHMLSISLVANRLEAAGIGIDDPLFYVIILPGTIFVSVVVIYLLGRLPYGKYLAGIKTAPSKADGNGSLRSDLDIVLANTIAYSSRSEGPMIPMGRRRPWILY